MQSIKSLWTILILNFLFKMSKYKKAAYSGNELSIIGWQNVKGNWDHINTEALIFCSVYR